MDKLQWVAYGLIVIGVAALGQALIHTSAEVMVFMGKALGCIP